MNSAYVRAGDSLPVVRTIIEHRIGWSWPLFLARPSLWCRPNFATSVISSQRRLCPPRLSDRLPAETRIRVKDVSVCKTQIHQSPTDARNHREGNEPIGNIQGEPFADVPRREMNWVGHR